VQSPLQSNSFCAKPPENPFVLRHDRYLKRGCQSWQSSLFAALTWHLRCSPTAVLVFPKRSRSISLQPSEVNCTRVLPALASVLIARPESILEMSQ
jgi:hypothetical protein